MFINLQLGEIIFKVFILLKGVAKEELLRAWQQLSTFVYHSSLTGNGLIIAGHTYKNCSFGALMYLLGLCQNNSFPGDCVLSFVWKKRERAGQAQHTVMGSCQKWSWLLYSHCKILFSAICNFVELQQLKLRLLSSDIFGKKSILYFGLMWT